jgi:SAM-dependent methyltransferase
VALLYRMAYAIGFKPWDSGTPPLELIRLVEDDGASEPARALDLGCGTGTNTVYLASHGWAATGVDNVERALVAARHKAAAVGVEPLFVKGDVTRLKQLPVGSGYTLILDLGCYHGLPHAQRDDYADGVTAVAAPGATLLLYAFLPKVLPKVVGVTADELEVRFSGWELVRAIPGRNWLPTTAFEMHRRS